MRPLLFNPAHHLGFGYAHDLAHRFSESGKFGIVRRFHAVIIAQSQNEGETLAHPYWFKAIFSFRCPSCQKTSIEEVILNSPTNDQMKIQAALDQQVIACQLCNKPLNDGAEVEVRFRPETPESLNDQGYVYSPSNKTYMKSQGQA